MSIEEVIIKNLDFLTFLLRSELEKKDINDTMAASKSIRQKKVTETHYKLIGVEYLEMLNKGRGGGGLPPVSALKKWVERKLGISKDKSESVAWRVAKKIENEGTEIFKDNSAGIELSKNIELMKEQLKKDLSNSIKIEITERLDYFNKKRMANIQKNGNKNI